MEPVILRSERLVLTIPTLDDVDRVAEYCRDPLFEQYLSTPWPYRRRDAEHFLGEVVPNGWRLGGDLVWALRETSAGPLLGVIGLHRRRPLEPSSVDLGYWLGAPHRGHGYMAEAARAVTGWALQYGSRTAREDDRAARDGDETSDRIGCDTVYWECAIGNIASAATARAAGFRFTGTGPSIAAARDGSHPDHWHGRLTAEDYSSAGGDGTRSSSTSSTSSSSDGWPDESRPPHS